jgi:hypothetical protein
LINSVLNLKSISILAIYSLLTAFVFNFNMTAYQPIHPDVRPLLDPEYAAFHDKYLQYVRPSETFDWDPAVRSKPSITPGGSDPVPVGCIRDVQLEHCEIRVFTPKGSAPRDGWPVCIWFHGGEYPIFYSQNRNAATNFRSS